MKWLLPQPNNNSSNEHASAQKFDKTTGQIFTETTVPIQSFDDRNWARRSHMVPGVSYKDYRLETLSIKSFNNRGTDADLRNHQNDLDGRRKKSDLEGMKGARSLQEAAIECILQNISGVTLDGIQCLPSHIVRRVWGAVNARCTMCFNTWLIFSKILRESDGPTMDLFRYRQIITQPKSPLPTYMSVLTSSSFDFITSLFLTVSFSIPDLVKLSGVVNLGVLHIVNEPGTIGIGDRIIRSWHSAALHNNSFQVLRILKLWHHKELTGYSLELVSCFPALAEYDVRGCNIDDNLNVDARNLGWKVIPIADYPGALNQLIQRRESAVQADGSSNSSDRQDPAQNEATSQPLPEKKKAIGDSSSSSEYRTTNGAQHLNMPLFKTWLSEGDQEKRSQSISTVNTAKYSLDSEVFTRIGEIRNDCDLLRAGLDRGCSFVEDTPTRSIPIATVCLGPASPFQPRGFVFFREKIPAHKNMPMGLFKSDQGAMVSNAASKRFAPSVMRTKRRKLDDVLGSFL